MQEIALKENDISKMKRYPLDGIISSESRIYYYKHNKDKSTILLKKLYNVDKTRVQRKIDTIDELQNSELSTYKELVLPDKYVTIKGINSGFTIKEVKDTTNLHMFLNSKKINREDKIKVLKRVGKLLKKVQSSNQEFYFGDLQSFNFLVDNKTHDIYVVDLDSSSTNKDSLLETKYIILDDKTHNISKYNVDNNLRCIPSKDVDLYCYNTLIFNYLSGININRLSFSDYYEYLAYLEECNIPKEMIDIYLYLYTEKSNDIVLDYLDYLPKDYGRVDYRVFKALKK